MARIFIDGFESGDSGLWSIVYNSPVVSSTPMDGTYYAQDNSTNAYHHLNLVATDTLYGAFLMWMAEVRTFCTLYNTEQIMIQFRVNSITQLIEAYVGASLVATGTFTVQLGNNTLFEFYIYIDNLVGRIVTKVDGLADIDFTGDTKPSTQTTINVFRIGGGIHKDNIILDDANWIGDTKIQAIHPTGAGTTTQWTPSAGANYTCVDEIPAVDTDWVETNTINLTDTYASSNLTGVIDNIKCVQVQARSMKEGAPTPLNIDLVVNSAGTDYLSTDKAVQSVTYKPIYFIWETDPATATPWLEATVNAAEIGIKSKT